MVSVPHAADGQETDKRRNEGIKNENRGKKQTKEHAALNTCLKVFFIKNHK